MKVNIYTDGACSGNPGPGGWAVVMNTEDGCKEESGYDISTTNNQMELTALLRAIGLVLVNNIVYEKKDVEYNLYSDSAYVINAITKGWVEAWSLNGWKTKKGEDVKNKDLWKSYLRLKGKLLENNVSIKYIKIKGHSGDTFNDYVDELAKKEVLKARKLLIRKVMV